MKISLLTDSTAFGFMGCCGTFGRRASQATTRQPWSHNYRACFFNDAAAARIRMEEGQRRADRRGLTGELTDTESGSNAQGQMIGVCAGVSDLCSSLRGPLAPHRRSPGSPPPAPGALLAQGEAEGAAEEEVHSPGLSAGSQACEHSSGGGQTHFQQESTSQVDCFTRSGDSEQIQPFQTTDIQIRTVADGHRSTVIHLPVVLLHLLLWTHRVRQVCAAVEKEVTWCTSMFGTNK